MTIAIRTELHGRHLRRLLMGASMAAVASGLAATPANAQLARLRAAAGVAVVPTAPIVSIPVRPVNMREALQRAQALQSRADQIRGYVTSARDAALAATRTQPSDGISDNGLDPIAAVREAAALTAQGGIANLARANELLVSVSSARDVNGNATWEGASGPVQTSAGGKTTVTITQTQDRALLSWNRFDIGANTTLQFDQKSGGIAQPGWTVVNRVINSIAPSTILGSIKADGTVLVLNRNGVIFGQGSQVNLNSLLVSTLEIGNYGRNFRNVQLDNGQVANVFDATTLKERNTEFLQNGLFATIPSSDTLPPLLLSSLYAPGTNRTDSTPDLEGDVVIDAGASITAGTGGYLIFAGPTVTNAGALSATDGQVSLQGGRLVTAVRSSGAATSADPDVRGLILRTIGTVTAGTRRSNAGTPLDPIADDGSVTNNGVIDSTRGYLSLGAGLFGNVTNNGLLAATTSVSRNGKISLTAGTVTLGGATDPSRASGIVITPDASAETIPQGTADAPPSFKTSVIEIGARADDTDLASNPIGIFIPSVVSMGQNAIILAPSANVTIGRASSVAYDPNAPIRTLSSITIATGAAIDVSGIKDVQLAAARNSVQITPVKRNELRDTPNYREVSLTGDFTLNGSTLFVDARLSGVRADGVAWIGSPLIEAGSIASQIGVSAAELMTKGGNVSLGVNLVNGASELSATPQISIAKGASIDFSGGWVHYNEGIVRTSNLLTADGRIVNIGEADPNDIFVGVADGFSELTPRTGTSTSFSSPLLEGGRFETAYDEGRDAGSLIIGGSSITIDGTFHGNAFAGARQISDATTPGLAATITRDTRLLQGATTDLPSGGFLRIGSATGTSAFAAGGDMLVYQGTRGAAAASGATTLLDGRMLSEAGLSGLTLQTTGAVTFAGANAVTGEAAGVLTLTGASDLTLADGGRLTVDAGRKIAFDGDVTIASGRIAARTYELSSAPIGEGSLTAIGSAFRSDDDIAGLYAVGGALPSPFDITVTGTLSTAGRWVNDYAATRSGAQVGGRAWIDGGSISLTVAPKVLVARGESVAAAETAGDLSGSIVIAPDALLNVSAGGYIASDGTFDLTARGGNIALINETTYASTVLTLPTIGEDPGRANLPIGGANQSVDFTPYGDIVPALVPADPVARISFSESSLRGFGFSGGGTFTLVAPDISFGSDMRAGATHLSLDFFRSTGFGTLDATTLRSRIVSDLFSNERAGNSAFFETSTFRVRNGETLDLTQTLLPAFLSQAQGAALLSLTSGADVTRTLTPGVPTEAFDRVAANLTLGGLTELDIDAGGRIIGAAGATITTPKLLNAGTILLPGGSIVQREYLPTNLALQGLGVRDTAFGGTGLAEAFGAADANGQFDENGDNGADVFDPLAPERLLTNRELVSRFDAERFVYFLGTLDAGEGLRFAATSVTDLSGVALVNTRAGYTPSGVQLLTGRVVAGGTISTASAFLPANNDPTRTLFTNPVYGNVRYLNPADNGLPPIVALTAARTIATEAGATIDISGAAAMFDQVVSTTSYGRVLQWSDGGRLSIGGGGSIAGATIDASGGNVRAMGGTIDWVNPIIVQTNLADAASGSVAAQQIMASGFDTVNALGGVTFDGAVSLTLGKAFTVQSIAPTRGAPIAPEAAITISATSGTEASVIAPYVRFASRIGSIPDIGSAIEGADAIVDFRASTGIDFVGGVLFDSSIASVGFDTPGDVRFIGVDDRGAGSIALPSLNGRVLAWGDMAFDAGRVYATTGTGNLQRFIEDRRAGVATTASPYLLAAIGDSAIRFGGSRIDATTPLSAGSYLKIQAATIEQNGYLAAPLGLLEIGSNDAVLLGTSGQSIAPTTSLTFGAGSITTVSGAGINVPYGTTTDLTEYFFSPSVGLPITATPIGQLTLAGTTIDIGEGAKIDGRGGGDVFAFEFVSGTGGSRDVLDRFNRDAFSSNGYDPVTGIGFQFADQRQVYAIVPADQARAIAAFDPIYSADYNAASNSDIYGAQVGQSITIDAAPGVAAGEYVLLPAHYALLPGAFRVVENVGAATPPLGTTQTLLDGSIVVGGNYSTAGTNFLDSTRRSFTLQSAATFLKFSRIETTGASETIAAQAAAKGEIAPRLPLDAARVVLSPQSALRVAGLFDTTAATGGRGAQFDITAPTILITDGEADPIRRTLVISDTTIQNLNANSLSIGAERADNADGTTTLGVIAKSITIADGVSLTAPELIFAVGGSGSTLTIESGARLTATGTLDDQLTGDYVIPSLEAPPINYRFDPSGIGAAIRLSSGGERLFARQGAEADSNTERPATLSIGAATLTGKALALDSSRDFVISDDAALNAPMIALSGDVLRFGERGIAAPLLGKLAAAARLTLRSPFLIAFDAGSYDFNNLVLDTPGLSLTPADRGEVTLNTDIFTLRNSAEDLGACRGDGGLSCGNANASLIVNATGLAFGSGQVRTYGFGGAVTLTGTGGSYIDGKGGLDTGRAALTLVTPFLADRAAAADPREQTIRPDFTFATSAAFAMQAPTLATGATVPVPVGNGAPGARIAIGTADAAVASVTIDGSLIRATSGTIDIQSDGDVTLTGAATLATPGFTRTFGDAVDSITVAAGGGTINLVSLTGNLDLGAQTALTVDTGIGNAGALNLIASNGAITLGSAINAGVTGNRDASLGFDSGLSAFDLGGFVTQYGTRFQGDIAIRSGAGDLALAAGQALRARSIGLTADGGAILLGGTLDTSGDVLTGLSATAIRDARVDGGDISLYAARGVSLAATALIDTHTNGYAANDTRSASAGDVTIGIDDSDAAIDFAAGARIDVGARQTEASIAAGGTGNRLVAQIVKDPLTLADTTVYRFAAADTGGTVGFRAPVIGRDADQVDIRLGGAISGARDIQIEGFLRYDLDALAESGLYSGIHQSAGGAIGLNFAEDRATTGLRNILTEDFVRGRQKSVVNFIRNFDITAVDGSSFDGIRLRPGIELVSTESISLDTNWNLAAGTLDQQAAIDAGLLQIVPQLGLHADGTPYYAVVPGREAELLQNHVAMLYRVGGSATGEAGVVTIRARGALDIGNSISDGFFSFRDRTDPLYMSYQLGGGDRTVHPAGLFGCGTTFSGDCSQVVSFDEIVSGDVDQNPDNIATISLVNPVAGSDFAPGILAPYSILANSAAALGSGTRGAGDPLGGADLFPLLDNGTTAVRSTSLRLVGGADTVLSANPLHIDRATGADVLVTGEKSYKIIARAGTSSYAGSFEVRLRPNPGTSATTPLSAAPGGFIAAVANSPDSAENLDPSAARDYYTVLNWGSTGAQADATRQRATAYFAANFPDAVFQTPGSGGPSTGVAAPLSVVLAFLQEYGDTYAQNVVSGAFPAPAPTTTAPISFGGGDTAYVNTIVRTGDGSIDIAAANNVDLRRTPTIVYRNAIGTEGNTPFTLPLDPTLYQVGGSAVYTAGHALAREAISASTADGETTIRFAINPQATGPAYDELAYQPSIKGQFLNTPQLLVDGGNVSIVATTGDVLARRDVWAEKNLGTGTNYLAKSIGAFRTSIPSTTYLPTGFVGGEYQRWRVGTVSQNTQIAVVPQFFTSGVGALAGGDVAIVSGGMIGDLTLALDTSVTTTSPRVPAGTAEGNPLTGVDAISGNAVPPVLLTFGAGSAKVVAGGNLIGGQFDFASGEAAITIDGDVFSAGGLERPSRSGEFVGPINELRIRIADATVALDVGGTVNLGGVGALGVQSPSSTTDQDAGQGFFSVNAGLFVKANGQVALDASRPELGVTNFSNLAPGFIGFVLPPSLGLTSMTDDVLFGGADPRLLYPSANGQLSILAGGEIDRVSLIMSDSDPSLLPGAFSAYAGPLGPGLNFGFNGALPGTTDAQLRQFHNERPTHAGDAEPVRIYAGGSITGSIISLPKQARIGAGLDIVDLIFVGQNVAASDITRITAGRDIIGTTQFSNTLRLPYINGNNFTLGGPGTLSIEAGRNLGPFLNSANVISGSNPGSYAGGIRTVGNDLNPWLPSQGASITALFGIANGADYAALQSVYLDPANAANLDGDLFEQISDESGNLSPDRARPVYAPILARWLRDNAPAAFATVFGATPPADTDLAALSYTRYGDLYAAFTTLGNLNRRAFLLDQLYFNELAQTSLPTGPSFQQYIRGYRATQTLFPTSLGYTDQLASYTTDPATVTPDNPLGVPTRDLDADGQPVAATRVFTGNVDLRLAAIETTRGGDVTIIGPGGDVLAGSVVRTSDQAARRGTLFGAPATAALENGVLSRSSVSRIASIPIGFEGVLTLRGGTIRSSTDGDFRLNQSRLFTLGGGDITLWSSNGDLNAGQGPRSASSFPPVTIRFDQNGLTEVDSAGSVSGAGIGGFQRTPDDAPATIILIAPVGEVDAGDAGVRASGNVFVAAARVANADNFAAGGEIAGVPGGAVSAVAVPADAASSIVGQIKNLASAATDNSDRQSLISVDVLGFAGGNDRCDDPNSTDPACKPK